MSKITVNEEVSSIYGNLIQIENGLIELKMTTDMGPRILHFSRIGMENMMYQDLEKKPLGEPQEIYGGDILKLYGGHRIWCSPEVMPNCYYPDNHPVSCQEIEQGMAFTAPVEKINNIQKAISVSLLEDQPVALVKHTIKNCGVWNIELAPWSITMTAQGGKMIAPMPNRETGYLANRNISLWPYSSMNDPRVYWGRRFITLTQDPSIDQPFKLGLNNEAGWAAVFNKGQVFFKFFEPILDGFYPDRGCSFETYTNGEMLEVETLGEIVYLEPGAVITHTEEWEIYESQSIPSNDENEIQQAIAPYIQ